MRLASTQTHVPVRQHSSLRGRLQQRASLLGRLTSAFLVAVAVLSANSAAALGFLAASPTTLNFGTQTVGTTGAYVYVTLTNTGNAVVQSISFVYGGSTVDYLTGAPDTNCGSSLAAGFSCRVGLKFSPESTGTRTASVTINSNASNSSLVVPMTGIGVQSCIPVLNPASFLFGATADASTVAVSVASGCIVTGTFSATSNVPWIHVTGSGSYIGPPGTVSYSVDANATGLSRTGTITIDSQPFPVTQLPSCVPVLSISSAFFGPGAGSGTVGVSVASGCFTSGTFSATSNASWIHVTGSGNYIGPPGTVSYTIDANATGLSRTGTISIDSQPFTVVQSPSCPPVFTPTTLQFGPTGGSGTVAVSVASGCIVTGTFSATSNASWIHVTGSGIYIGPPGTVAYTVDANATGSSRSGTITIDSQPFTVTQQAATVACTYTLNPTSASFAAAGGSGSVGVSASASACIAVDSPIFAKSNNSWIILTNGVDAVGGQKAYTGPGSATVTYVVQPNPDTSADQGSITIAGKTFTVNQAGAAAASIELNQHGLTGSWYEPATGGQGFEVEIFPDRSPGTGLAFLSWFTYDTLAGGAERQRWYTLSGNVVSGLPSATLTIYQNIGGNFNAPPVTMAQPVGSATLSFDTCTSGKLDYSFTDGTGRAGSIPLSRLTQNVTCSTTSARPTNGDFSFSGNWFSQATSGQGFTIEVNPTSRALFAAWYTSAPNGASAGAAGQRWYTAQATYAPGARSIPVLIYESKGGVFDTPTPPGQATVAVGSGSIVFQSCSAATMSYVFTGGSSSGMSGTIALTRVGPVPSGCTQ